MFCWRNFFLIETRTHGLETFQVQLEHNLWITPSSHCESPNAVFPVLPSVAIVIGTGNRLCCCCYVSINQICQSTNPSSCMTPPLCGLLCLPLHHKPAAGASGPNLLDHFSGQSRKHFDFHKFEWIEQITYMD